MRNEITLKDISRECEQLIEINRDLLAPLPHPYEQTRLDHPVKLL